MVVLEGLWDCAQCLNKGIPGGQLTCPRCGDPRNPGVDQSEKPYLPTDAREVVDMKELQLANAGPNWNCGKCGATNLATAKVCSNCSEALGANDDVAQVVTYVSGKAAEGKELSGPDQLIDDHTNAVLQWADPLQQLEHGPVRSPDRTLSAEHIPRSSQPRYNTEPTSRSAPFKMLLTSRRVLIAAGIAAALLVLLGGSVWLIYSNVKTHSVTLTVQSMSWERKVEVEAFRTLTQEDWIVPSDGRIIGSRREIRSYVQVFDHNEQRSRQVAEQQFAGTHQESYVCGSKTVDKGNGYFSTENQYCSRSVNDYRTVYHTEPYTVPVYRQQPVFDTKYTYQVDRWVTDHFAKASGSSNPYWPTPDVHGSRQRIGDERQAMYSVVLVDGKGKRFTREPGATIWSRLTTSEQLQGKENSSGSLKEVDWPKS